MGGFVKGDVVVVPFPFSDLTQAKRRPALIVAVLKGDDVILCQITSQNVRDEYSIALSDENFKEGSLNRKSNIRPNRIFTADSNIILYRAGRLKDLKFSEVVKKIIGIIEG